MKQLITKLVLGFIFLWLILAFEHYTDWDTEIADLFYDRPHNGWLIPPELHRHLDIFFYSGIKKVLMLIGIFCFVRLLASIKYSGLRASNHHFLILLLSIIFVPLVVAGAKYFTNVYCPYQLDIYNGAYPFVRIIDAYPADFIQPKPGRCFPAGHATAGFALMALFYCFKSRRNRYLGLSLGIIAGWVAGIYQMMRGQHFLSHTMFSMVASFMVIMIINAVVRRYDKSSNQYLKTAC